MNPPSHPRLPLSLSMVMEARQEGRRGRTRRPCQKLLRTRERTTQSSSRPAKVREPLQPQGQGWPGQPAPLGVSPRAGDADAEGDGLAFEPPALPHQPTPSPIEQVSPTEAVGGVIEPAAKPMG